MNKKKLVIISNDKLFCTKKEISSDYNDTISIIESLNKAFKLKILSRKSNKRRNFIYKNKLNNFKKLKFLNLMDEKQSLYFMISITPFNYFIFVILKILNNNLKGYVYLRSDGFKEYFYKYGNLGNIFYNFMFKAITKNFEIITVSKNLTGIKKKYKLVIPSELNKIWRNKQYKPNIDKPRLLYVGRFKKEKGIFSLLNIMKKTSFNFELNVVGTKEKIFSKDKRINFFREENSTKKIIKFYDNSNIFILPSFTEGSPKVILESLARFRPIIIFEEIIHVKNNLNKIRGIYVSKRNKSDYEKKINYIMKNYNRIYNSMKKNKLPAKVEFQKQLAKLI